MKINDQLNN